MAQLIKSATTVQSISWNRAEFNSVRPKLMERWHRQTCKAVALAFLALVANTIGCGGASGAAPVPTPTPGAAPAVTTISPNGAPVGSVALTLTVNGSNFTSSSVVQWNASNRATTAVSNSRLKAQITAADLAVPQKAAVTVLNSASGVISSPATFTVVPDTITFQSSRALDGSDAANTNNTANIWVMNSDGSGTTPLTKLTALNITSRFPVWSADGGKILFASGRALDGSDANSAGFNLWSMNADGTSLAPVTKAAHTDSGEDGVWSPDGTKIAFDSSRALDGSDADNPNSTFNVWIVNADGSGLGPLTKLIPLAPGIPPEGSFMDSWSPDSSKITFESERVLDGSNAFGTQYNIWVANADGSGATPLTKLSQASSFLASWSPDGTKIAFESGRVLDGSDSSIGNGITNVWVMNADGSSVTPLTQKTACTSEIGNRAGPFASAWSRDGSKIVLTSNCALDGSNAAIVTLNIWVVKSDGTGLTPLTKLTANVFSEGPIWSPDGSRIFFDSIRALDGSDTANTNNTDNIWVMNSDGSGATPLTKLTAAGANSGLPNLP